MTADSIEKSKKDDKPNVFVRFGKRISRFFREYKSEVKKITWPDFKTVVKKTFVVFVVVLVVGIGIWAADFIFSQLIEFAGTIAG